MGCFGYMCKCGLSIRGGEQAVLKHIRHGEVLGETVGTYNFYGGVEEDRIYRNDDLNNINCHEEIWKSEFQFSDSEGYYAKLYKGIPVQWTDYTTLKRKEGFENLTNEIYKEWETLEVVPLNEIRSGTEAWHKRCYDKASDKEKSKHVISEDDPNQSWGNPRKRFL